LIQVIQVVAFTITLTFAFTFTFTSNFMSTGRSFSPSTFTTRTQEGEEEEEPVDEFTCQFCGVRDTSFTEEKLDLHFWKDCPLLMPCEQCGQIVEVAVLSDHLMNECDQSQSFRYPPPLGTPGNRACPHCQQELPTSHTKLKQHLQYECQGNPRRS